MMARMYSFSHNKAKSLRMSSKKVNQSKIFLNTQLQKTLYQSMKITEDFKKSKIHNYIKHLYQSMKTYCLMYTALT